MIRPFDPCGPLPAGTTVLEASAGTGKTYTIAALAARYVAEGTPLEHLLLVTFTRLATGELRERVRDRLVAVERGLAAVERGHVAPDASPDEVARLLARGHVATHRRNLARALEGFDAATIATIHEFCAEVLGSLGIAGDVDREYALLDDPRDLVDEVVDDLYAQRYALHPDPPAFDRRVARQIAEKAIANPAAPIVPDRDAGGAPGMRARFAAAVRVQFDARKRRLGLITYDDLLTRLRDALAGPGGADVTARLRARYRVVLVDEFQDTDPVQWEIMERAFTGDAAEADGGAAGSDARRALVLIGDPKQAIYSFRGADVYAYLRAAERAADRATLATNWRSDRPLIDAYAALFDGAHLGHPGIVHRPVRPAHASARLTGAPEPAALRVRVVDRSAAGLGLTKWGYADLADARAHVAEDAARDIARLLHARPRLTDADRALQPGDIAVLVRRHRSAEMVQAALAGVGVPAVINGAGSVFATPAAAEWLRLLEGLERPAARGRARSAALTCFLAWTAEDVARADEGGPAGDAAWETVYRRLHAWARVLRTRGVASLVEAIMLGERLPERVLARRDGERRLTDVRHVGELLHAAATTEQLGTNALTAWLRRRVREATTEAFNEERSRRLESDAQAVQVLTIHRAKGLEFPVVHCPDLWEPSPTTRKGEPVDFHDSAAGDERRVDVGLEGREYEQHRRQHVAETRGEDLRLAYVALTRARHQAVVWWAGSWGSRHSALGRLLFARGEDGAVATEGSDTPSDEAAREAFAAVAARAPGCIAVEDSVLGGPVHWSPPLPAVDALAAADWRRELDWRWRRTSYSDIAAGAHEATVASEPEEAAVVDEPVTPVPVAAGDGQTADAALAGVPSLLGAMPVGVHVGTLVHRVFETVDFAAPDLEAEVSAKLDDALARRPLELGDRAAAVRGLAAAVETPLGPWAGCRLRDVARGDRLDELAFELPLAGGDDPDGEVRLEGLAGALRDHLPAGDPLAGYAERLGDPGLRPAVRGYLTGSIDLVFRTADGRHFVADYKTNWLAEPDEPLTAWHHRPAALAVEMERRHYPLQALLYTVALHRFLRWRLPEYRPDRHLGGVLYLFVRGMSGPDTPRVDGAPCGVFGWRPPGALVEALSDVLAGATA